jgi:hypothetical protein
MCRKLYQLDVLCKSIYWRVQMWGERKEATMLTFHVLRIWSCNGANDENDKDAGLPDYTVAFFQDTFRIVNEIIVLKCELHRNTLLSARNTGPLEKPMLIYLVKKPAVFYKIRRFILPHDYVPGSYSYCFQIYANVTLSSNLRSSNVPPFVVSLLIFRL